MIMVSMLISTVRGKDKAIGVVFVWPCGVNTADSIEGIHTINHVSTPEMVKWQQSASNEKHLLIF